MADIVKINLNGTDYTIVDSAATSAIATEVSRAQGAESAITSALSAEVIARQSADTAIETTLSGKADAATTLSGYGITDAYTSAQTESAITQATSGLASTGYVQSAITSATSGLQETLTAGAGIAISSANVISCTLDTGLYVVVTTLPAEPAAGNENKIHLVPDPSGVTGNEYIEYLWKGDEWEEIGKTTVETDLSVYWTSAQTQSAITAATSGLASTGYVDSAVTAATSGLASEAYVGSAITNALGEALLANPSYSSVTDVLVAAGVGDIGGQGTFNPNSVATETYVLNAVSGITAQYSAATETLILNIPAPASE